MFCCKKVVDSVGAHFCYDNWLLCPATGKRFAIEEIVWKEHVAFGVGFGFLDFVQCFYCSFRLLSIWWVEYEFLVCRNVYWFVHFNACTKENCGR